MVTDKPLAPNKQGVGGHNHPPKPNIRLTLDQLQLPLIGKMTKPLVSNNGIKNMQNELKKGILEGRDVLPPSPCANKF